MQRRVVEDRHAGGLASGSRSGGNGDQRLERPGSRLSLSDGRVDVVEKVGRIRGVEIGRFRGIDGRSAAHGDERVEVALRGELDRLAKGDVGRLDVDAIEQRVSDPVVAQALDHGDDGREPGEIRIGEDHHSLRLDLGEIRADLAKPPLNARGERGQEFLQAV